MNSKKYELGITFSGGAARSYAQVGMLKALVEHGIEPQIISGTSMGAIVGALYAAGHSPEAIEKILVKKSIVRLMKFSWKKQGLMKLEKLKKELPKYIPEDDFSALDKPLYIGVSNLNEARKEFFHSGTLYDKLIASCSAPGFFAPKVIDGTSYVDGGLMCNLPASAIRDKCKVLIGAHVNYPGRVKKIKKLKDYSERIFILGINQNIKPEMELCDYWIDPPQMQNFSLLDFDKAKSLVKEGYRFTIEMVKEGRLPAEKLGDRGN